MYTSSILVVALSAFTAALPAITRQEPCSTPTSFTINGFSTFTPATGNPVPAAVSFAFSDNGNSTSRTACSRTGDINSTSPITCSDGRTIFRYVNKVLTVGELYTSCATQQEVRIYGDIAPSTYCIPSEPPEPNGFGTQCLTPTGQISGSFSRDTLEG